MTDIYLGSKACYAAVQKCGPYLLTTSAWNAF